MQAGESISDVRHDLLVVGHGDPQKLTSSQEQSKEEQPHSQDPEDQRKQSRSVQLDQRAVANLQYDAYLRNRFWSVLSFCNGCSMWLIPARLLCQCR